MGKQLYIGIDLQEGFLTDEIRQSDYCARVENFLSQLDMDDIVLTRFINQAGSNFETLLDWSDMQQSDPTIKLFGDLESHGYDVIEKTSYTAWIDYVRQKLESTGATEVILFGLDSDACVLKTALDVFEAGYQPIVLSDLCDSSAGTDRNQIGIALLTALIGERQVTTSSMMPPRA